MHLSSVFIHGDLNSEDILERAARGEFRVIFACPEMVESLRFARILHCEAFKSLLQAIYIDEAHSVYESWDWRPAYSRISGLRRTLSQNVPLIALSATLPTPYRTALLKHAGLHEDYILLNLGNFRPELSLAVMPLKYDKTSFQDLAFTLPWGISAEEILVTLIYCDDIVLLTQMFWWFWHRLKQMGLPTYLVDILHAGLLESHESVAMDDIRRHRTRIFLATEKVGAGINFSGIRRMIQYLAKNLSISRLDQRRRRMARDDDLPGMGYLFIEEQFFTDGELNSEDKVPIDEGILKLVRTPGCYQEVLGSLLENPPSFPSLHTGRLLASLLFQLQPRAQAVTGIPSCDG